MRAITQLKQQIEECDNSITQSTEAYARSKKQVHVDMIDLKRHLPLLMNIMLGGGLILLISPRARRAVGRINSKILVLLVNIRLGMGILSILGNTVRQGRKLFLALE
ncbi:MAG: hypothetical protein K2Q14_07780 [Gammaproteobacteria bacterium]|nr:hypothetical protein [Gammaproteobacteria bacterium]